MKRAIKFRGRDYFTGETVYGDLQTHFRTDGYTKSFIIRTWEKLEERISVAPEKSVIVPEYKEHPVAPDSIAQLVGYDSAGNEVYEGDELVNRNFQVDFFTAVLFDGVITDEGFSHDIPVEMLTLKE